MGRYYHGDIEGKFWFGVQSSNDADFFGVEGYTTYLNYGFDKEDQPKVKEGLKNCENTLGKYKKLLDEFFETDGKEGYNEGMLIKFLDKKESSYYPLLKEHPHKHTERDVMYYLEWYARYDLGKQIDNCIDKEGYCNFEAEL